MLHSFHLFGSIHSQFGQCGEKHAVGGILLQVFIHCLNYSHVVIQLSWPLTNQCGKTLCEEQQKELPSSVKDAVVMHSHFETLILWSI